MAKMHTFLLERCEEALCPSIIARHPNSRKALFHAILRQLSCPRPQYNTSTVTSPITVQIFKVTAQTKKMLIKKEYHILLLGVYTVFSHSVNWFSVIPTPEPALSRLLIVPASKNIKVGTASTLYSSQRGLL